MASTGQKWAIGCGIGCGLFLLVLVAGFMVVKTVIGNGKEVEASYEQLTAEFGSAEDYTPLPDGSIPAERMEIFLSVRETMGESADKLAHILYMLDDEDGVEVEASGFEKVKAGLQMLPRLMDFLKTRNAMLLEQGMGNGEYVYIYSLAYFDYLDKPVADGSSLNMSDSEGTDSGVHVKFEGGEQTTEDREKEVRQMLHRIHLAVLNNQIGVAGELPELIAEREVMVENSRRLLWEEGLPPAISASFAPFADRLEESYIPILNLMEVGLFMGD